MNDVEKNIDEFLDNHLRKYENIVNEHKIIMEKCPDIEYPKIDFLFCFPFVERELSHLKSLDYSVISYDIKKSYSYAQISKKIYLEFKNNLIPAKNIFLNKFTSFNPEFNEIKIDLEKATKIKYANLIRADSLRNQMSLLLKIDEEDFDDKQYKENKKSLANALTQMDKARKDIEISTKKQEELKEKYLSIFTNKYDERNDKIIDSLNNQIGFFMFYVDSLIWDNASYSYKIKEFFDFIQIKNLRLSTYMTHHLKHQTSLSHKNKILIEFRKNLIQIIEIIKNYEKENKNLKIAS